VTASSTGTAGRATAGAALLAGCAFLASGAIGEIVLDGIPHVADGVSYTFQGRILAAGRLWLEPPVPREAFEAQTVILDAERWCSLYPPGWPLLLAVGWWLGAPQWVAPLLFGGSVAALFQLGRRLYGDTEALVAAALLAVSPFGLLMGASHMAHVPTLAASLGCGLALQRAGRSGRARDALLAGAAGGLAVAIRPVSAVALLAPAALALLWGRRERALPLLGGLALGVAPAIALLLAHQAVVFGDPLTTGYQRNDPTHSFFGMGGAEVPLAEVLAAGLPWYAARLSESLWGLPGSDGLLLLALVPLVARGGWRATDGVVLACATSLVLVYSFYFYRDVAYGGPRLVFEALGPLCLLAARGLVATGAALREALREAWPGAARALPVGLLVGLLVWPLANRLPGQLRRHAGWYHGNSAELVEQVRARVGPEALVLLDGPSFSYGSLLLHNALDPAAGGRVYARDRGSRAALLEHFARPETWRLTLRLAPLPGPNFYTDRWQPEILSLDRVALTPPAVPERSLPR